MGTVKTSLAKIIYSGAIKIRRKFGSLKSLKPRKSWTSWEEIDHHFLLLSQENNLKKFRRDEQIIETMEYQNIDAWAWAREAEELGIIEPKLGKPYRPLMSKNSLNLGHQFRHLKKWSENPGLELSELSRVVEFGAGFGMMCWLVFQLGFDKEYVIIDNGGTSALQKKYLRETLTKEQFKKVKWISTLDSLAPNLASSDLFIAMWSASETPDPIFEKVLMELQERSPRILFAFQGEFKGRNNSEFIKKYSIQGNFSKVENWPSFYLCH